MMQKLSDLFHKIFHSVIVYITEDKKITLTGRTLYEYSLPDITDKELNEFIAYSSNKCTFKHNSFNEFIFWVPDNEELLNEEYNDAPQMINEAVKAAFLHHKKNQSEDFGYVLIVQV